MNIERIEVENNKKFTALLAVLDFTAVAVFSACIALAPVSYGEIASVEYKGFLSDGVSGLRHLKINLKDNCGYEKKLNFLQKCGFYLGFKQIELHLFCGKAKLKEIAEILKRNLAEYGKQVNNGEAAQKSAGDFPPDGI